MFNKNHPELKDGEMWITNTDIYEYNNNIRYKTKRKGTIAFTKNDKIINDMYPVFIQISEYNEVQNAYKHHKFRF